MITSLVSTPRSAAMASVAYVPNPPWNQWRGTWSASTAYVPNDGVYFNFATWICLAANTGTAPPTTSPPASSATWGLVAPGVDPTALNAATTAAAASAAGASASASASAGSASAASGSASAAAGSAGAASGSATAASGSATAAATAATNAGNSATAAATSATNAANSAAAAATSAATTKSIPVRQTVQCGPIAGGQPSFLPATSASLSLASQGVAAGSPLSVTAAQGFGANGAVNQFVQLTANVTWSSLAASATNYLYVNAATGAPGSTTLAPIYQFGGTISTAAGQFTFDTQAMVGYLGNGSAALAMPLVFVGEAVTSASAVTSSVAYAYNGFAILAQTSLAAGTRYTLAHNIGSAGLAISAYLECLVAEQGYAVGDRVYNANDGNAGSGSSVYGLFVGSTAKVVYLTTGVSGIGIFNTSGANANAFTAANWRAGVLVKRAWGGA